ncbi:hypothetical protein [Niastella populi]|uniref:Uncharacterized protein n=1 Tax=Niastella populi TaxID=550983 RepID=A0A1V9EUY6_9BACT|nr:hypothetical protein [Niastella populi]OQP49966.1 hypothetical protein A4R26_30075 [Niastella populi]
MLENKVKTSGNAIFSPEKIKELNKLMSDKVAEVMRLQRIGELPCASKIPQCHVKRRDVMEIMGLKEAQAGRVMALARKKANKKRGQYITIKEFCDATKLDEFTVQRALDMCPMMNYLGKKPPHLRNKEFDAE